VLSRVGAARSLDLCGVGFNPLPDATHRFTKALAERLFDETFAAFGRVDVVVNNAGMILKKPVVEVTEDDFDRIFGINTKAAFFVMQEAARRISDEGRIINMGTTLLAATTAFYGVYAGSKAPLEDFTRALAREIGARGVTVNTVAPGPIDTPFYHGQENAQSTAYATQASVAKRLGTIDDVVPLIEFLASPRSQWITAQTLFINGGYLTRCCTRARTAATTWWPHTSTIRAVVVRRPTRKVHSK
jgi:NAD(P)-dependent dehydrogenase (short-subunit alcohol dehydrogenase family)